jgi:quinol monooxygenase YgiN
MPDSRVGNYLSCYELNLLYDYNKSAVAMIVEYIRYKIPQEKQKQFETAYENAAVPLNASPHCLKYELSHCAEQPDLYILRIEWDSHDGHMKGFRSSPEFRKFFELIKPFFDNIEEMRHYELTRVTGGKVS